MDKGKRPLIALFFCQNIPESNEERRQALEREYGGSLKLYPLPCSGRIEPLHLLKALEEFADAAYVITCPEGACRYFEGNFRARKRVERTREIISSIGLERERIGFISLAPGRKQGLSSLAREIRKAVNSLPPSPLFRA